MKKHIPQFLYIAATAATIAASTLTADGQTVTRDSAGNYSATPKSQETTRDSTTTFTFTDPTGRTWPVYVGSKGAHYVARVSKKSGKYYRQYLTTEK